MGGGWEEDGRRMGEREEGRREGEESEYLSPKVEEIGWQQQ